MQRGGLRALDTVLRFIGAMTLLVLSAAIVMAAFGHDANTLRAGTFGAGSWVFPGSLGLGGVTPTAMLTVPGNVSLNGTLFVVNGSVGIGTQNPAYPLHVNGNARLAGVLITLDNGVTSTSLNYNVNEGGYGGAALVLCSSHFSTGDSTRAAVYLIRAGFDGNNFQATYISGNNIFTFSAIGGILHAGGWDAGVGATTLGACRVLNMGAD